MDDRARRKDLVNQYKQNPPEAGVYRIVNTCNNRLLVGSSTNLASIKNKLDFARSTNSPSALDHRLGKDIREFGLDAFTFDVLERLEVRPEMTTAEIRDELATLEALCREQLDPALLY
jgi:hypothetical protein